MKILRKIMSYILLVLLKIIVAIVNGQCYKQEGGNC